MKKLKMDLEMLAVESFETAAGAKGPRGTVQGHATEYGGNSCQCQNLTHWESCYGGCGPSFGPEACTME